MELVETINDVLEDDIDQTQDTVNSLSSKLRVIDTTPFLKVLKGFKISGDIGKIPVVLWVPIKNLRINDAYQREVRESGRSNVIQIAKNFNWSKFVLVAGSSKGQKEGEEPIFSIIDGQHRTIGAAVRGIDAVPCLALWDLTVEQQADIFAAINGKVTGFSPLAIFHAEVASQNPEALKVLELAKSVGVTFARYVKPSTALMKGETVSVNTIQQMMKMYDHKLVALALKCILKASKDHNDLLNSNVIRAMCSTLDAEGTFRVPEYRLIHLMENFDLHREWMNAIMDAKTKRKYVAGALQVRIFKYLDSELNE